MSSHVKIKLSRTLPEDVCQSQGNVYYAGQIVNGTVEICIDEVKNVKSIHFQVCGVIKTKWGIDSLNKYFSEGCENFYSTKKYFLETDNDTGKAIDPGTYYYNFACIIPKQLPSSLEGTHGYVRYVTKVTIETPFTCDETFTEPITILKPLDLNLEADHSREPGEVEVYQQFWCGLCTSKAIHIKGKLPRSGYIPGETIPLEVDVINSSNIDIKELKLTLQCVISYQADTPELMCRQEIKDLTFKQCDPVPKQSNVTINYEFSVPSVPSSSNSTISKIIQIAYCIRIEAVTSYMHKNAYVLFPITIGTVAFDPKSVNKLRDKCKLSPIIENRPDPLPILDPVRTRSLSSEVTEL